MSGIHGDQTTTDGIHITHNWEFADKPARDSTTNPKTLASYTADDVYKFGLQLDDYSLWLLTDTTPTWVGVSVNSAVSGLTAGRVVFVASDGSLTDVATFYRTASGQILINTITATTGAQLDVAGDIVVSDGAGGEIIRLSADDVSEINGAEIATYKNGGANVTLDNVPLHLPFTAQNNYANLNGHLGQAPSTASGSIIGVDGGKSGSGAVSTVQGFTNLHTNPYPGTTTGWTQSNVTGFTIKSGGKYGNYGSFTPTAQYGKVYMDVAVSGSTAYSFRGMIKSTSAQAVLFVREYPSATTFGVPLFSDGTGEWLEYSFTGTTLAGTTFLRFHAGEESTTFKEISFHALQLTASSYTFPFRAYGMNEVSGSSGNTSVVTGALLKYANPLSPYKGAIGGWVKVDDNNSLGGQLLWSLGATNTEFDAYIEIDAGGDFIKFRQNSSITQVPPRPTAGTWFHIAVSWDYSASEIKYFINGTQVGATVSYVTLLDFGTNMGILCSANLPSSATTNGYAADWFLSTEPISAADVKKIYDSGVPVNVPHANHELSVAGDDGEFIINANGVNFSGLPTSSVGLSTGDLWNNVGVINIV